MKILILYDAYSTFTKTVYEYLSVFKLYSKYKVHYAHACDALFSISSLEAYDAVLIHYSVRLSLQQHISERTALALMQYKGPKVLFIQDEYDTTEVARTWIEKLGIDIVYTCVPKEYQELVYPAGRFPQTQFKHVLTGYVPVENKKLEQFVQPLHARKNALCYRGRMLPFRYGSLGNEKYIIGKKMKEICENRQIPHDIELDDYKRIYGDDWYRFLGSSRATLGTESGSNVFDFNGKIEKHIAEQQKLNPDLTYDEIHESYIAQFEKTIKMNQISPKFFESIALRTGMILFEGSYSDILKPDVHYIPLRKDFSNIDDVLHRLFDDKALQTMTHAAYLDVIESGKYQYADFIRMIDDDLETLHRTKSRVEPNEKMKALLVTDHPMLREEFTKTLFRIQKRRVFKLLLTNPRYLPGPILRLVASRVPEGLRRKVMNKLPSSVINFIRQRM